MGFFAPWFLAGLAAIGLPVWLHLLQQHRVDPVKFPSLQFFEKRTQTSVRQRRLKYRVLLALRILMFLLLALLFAQPFIRRQISAGTETRHVILAIDRSFSMRAENRLADAKTQALAEVDRLRPNATAQVVTLGGGAQLVTQATRDKAELRSAIASIQPGSSRSAFAEIARTARVISEARKLPVDVHLFSDFQRSSMPSSFQELGLPAGVSMISHRVGGEKTPNFAVENVSAPTAIADGKTARLTATIRGFSTEETTRNVALALNGKILQTKPLRIPAGGRVTVEFIGLDASYGWNRGEVRLEGGDALSDDNAMRFAVERADPRKVLFVHEPGRTRSALYFRSALESAAEGLFALEPVAVSQVSGIDPSKYALVVLSDVGSVPQGFETKLHDYVKAGGGVWIAAGATSASRGAVPFTGAKIGETVYAARSAERFYSASKLDLSHPSVGRANRWEGVQFYQASVVDPGKASVVASLSNGSPLLIESREGRGRILTFASGLENVSNDFPLHTSFVPFVEQTARHLAGLESRSSTVAVDSLLELQSGGMENASAIEVLDPQGKRMLDLNAASSAQTLRVNEEGFYEINRQNNRRELVAVNADRAESALEPMPGESIELWSRTGDGAPVAAGTAESVEQRKPVSLWWWVALLLLIATLAESLVAARRLEPEAAS